MFWKKWNEPLCVGSFPVEHPGDANINTKRSFLFFRTCSRRLPISKASKVLDSGLQTGVRKPRWILDGLNVLRARHTKRPGVISWQYLDCNRLSLIKSPFLNYSSKYAILSAEVASKIEMVIFRKKLLIIKILMCEEETQIQEKNCYKKNVSWNVAVAIRIQKLLHEKNSLLQQLYPS